MNGTRVGIRHIRPLLCSACPAGISRHSARCVHQSVSQSSCPVFFCLRTAKDGALCSSVTRTRRKGPPGDRCCLTRGIPSPSSRNRGPNKRPLDDYAKAQNTHKYTQITQMHIHRSSCPIQGPLPVGRPVSQGGRLFGGISFISSGPWNRKNRNKIRQISPRIKPYSDIVHATLSASEIPPYERYIIKLG